MCCPVWRWEGTVIVRETSISGAEGCASDGACALCCRCGHDNGRAELLTSGRLRQLERGSNGGDDGHRGGGGVREFAASRDKARAQGPLLVVAYKVVWRSPGGLQEGL